MENTANKPLQSRDTQKEEANKLVFSYLALRNLIGITGMLLPLALALLPSRSSRYYDFEPSISDYYYTDRGDVLVVLLCVIGVFLFTYKGYTTTERILTIVAGVCGIGVAFVPTGVTCDTCDFSIHTKDGGIFPSLAGTAWHFVFAAVFFICLSIISIWYFTRTHKEKIPTSGKARKKASQKTKRNRVYRTTGWVMLGCIGVIGIYFLIHHFTGFEFEHFPIVYIFETIAIEAFGISWLTKGETLWPDRQSFLVRKIRSIR